MKEDEDKARGHYRGRTTPQPVPWFRHVLCICGTLAALGRYCVSDYRRKPVGIFVRVPVRDRCAVSLSQHPEEITGMLG